jgi:hypothetical protein
MTLHASAFSLWDRGGEAIVKPSVAAPSSVIGIAFDLLNACQLLPLVVASGLVGNLVVCLLF